MQQAVDVNQLFARAERAFVERRFDEAAAGLEQVMRVAGDHPAVLHLLALVEKNRGRSDEAQAAFERALRLSPSDPQINNNFANYLDQMDEYVGALAAYDRAIAAAPSMVDPLIGRAVVLEKLGRLDEALAAADRAVALAPGNARTHSVRGGILKQLKRMDESAAAYDRALELAPTRLVALHGRARVAMERGEPSAADLYRRALEQAPDDRELVLGLAQAIEAEGGESAIPLLEQAVRDAPGWIEGHVQLTRMRSEAGDPEDHTRSFKEALAVRRYDSALHGAYWQELGRASRYEDGLAAIRDAADLFVGDENAMLVEAVFSSEVGDLARAEALFAETRKEGGAVALAYGRHLLRAGDPEQSARILEGAVDADPDDIGAWAHLSLAWRLLGDSRHEWLCGQPDLFSTRELAFDPAKIAHLAEVLRGLHRTRAHPIGQSLRGGTQTRGALFWRTEPEVVELREKIRTAIDDFTASLPPADPKHPLLKHRDRPKDFSGSWSVRLHGSGYHVSHIHPEGILSSACYIALPEAVAGNTKEGWLEIGAPPVELGLKLGPLAMVQPKPGRLALFPSYLFHGTRPFPDGERLTVAFDVVPQ